MSANLILKQAVFASLFTLASAAPAAFAGLPAPSFNDFPEHYAATPVVQDPGVKGFVGASFGTSEALWPVPSFNDHPEHYSAAKFAGAKTGTRVTATANAGGSAESFGSPRYGVPAY